MSRNPDRKSCTDPAGLPGANFLLYFRIKGSKIAVWFLLRLLKVETFQLNGFREQLLDADPDAFPFHGFWSQVCESSSGSALKVWTRSCLCWTLFLFPRQPRRLARSRRVQDRFPGCWVRMWLLRRATVENFLPHSEQRGGESEGVPSGGENADDVSAAAFSAT